MYIYICIHRASSGSVVCVIEQQSRIAPTPSLNPQPFREVGPGEVQRVIQTCKGFIARLEEERVWDLGFL